MHEHKTAPDKQGILGGNGQFQLLLSITGQAASAIDMPVTHGATGGNFLFILALPVLPVIYGARLGTSFSCLKCSLIPEVPPQQV